MSLISDLIDIKTAYTLKKAPKRVQKCSAKAKLAQNPVDEDFEKLKCSMDLLGKTSHEYKTLDEYVQNTRDGQKIKIIDAFKIEREGEKAIFNPNKLGGKKLLFHGSRFSNYVGIISNGMRIAPKEAPCTGYLFGKGVYFANMAGKSADYTCSELSNDIGIFVMCEVACGKANEVLFPTFSSKLPSGTHSTRAVGMTRPDPSVSKTMEKDIEIPLGKTKEFKKGHMCNDEFIVYNTNQIRMRYILKCKIDY